MNTRKFLLFLCALATLGNNPLTGHAAPLDFSALAGSYRAKFTLTQDSLAFAGNSFDVDIRVPKNGRQAQIAISGYASTTQGSLVAALAFLGDLKFRANRQVTTNNSLLAYTIQTPAVGRLDGRKNLSFTLIHNSPELGNVTMNYTLRSFARDKRLLITGSGLTNGSATVVTLSARKRPGNARADR